MAFPIGNSPIQHTPLASAAQSSAAPTSSAAAQEPAKAKSGFFSSFTSIFQRAKTTVDNVPKPITNRTVFSSIANLKLVVEHKGVSGAKQALVQARCLKELGSLKEQRADVISNKGSESALKKIDDAIGERSKLVSAKDWIGTFGNGGESCKLIMSLPKNSPVRQEMLQFAVSEFCTENLMLLQVGNDSDNLTRDGMIRILNDYVIEGSPNQVNISSDQRKAAASAFFKAEARGDTSVSTYKDILKPGLDEVAKLFGRDSMSRFRQVVNGESPSVARGTLAENLKRFDDMVATLPQDDKASAALEEFQNIRLRDDPNIPSLFEGNTTLKTASKETLFGDSATAQVDVPVRSPAGSVAPTGIATALTGRDGDSVANASSQSAQAQPSANTKAFVPSGQDPLGQIRERQQLISSLPTLELNDLVERADVSRDQIKNERPGSVAHKEATELLGHINKAISDQQPPIGNLPSLDLGELVRNRDIARAQIDKEAASGDMSAHYKDQTKFYEQVNRAVAGQVGKTAAEWLDGFKTANNGSVPRFADFNRLPSDHPVRIALDSALMQMKRSDQLDFLVRFEGVNEMTLGQARGIAEEFLASNSVNLEAADINATIKKLGGELTMERVGNSSFDFKETIAWGEQSPGDAMKPPLDNLNLVRQRAEGLLNTNIKEALQTEFFVAP